ncbi:radical SAM protein [Desulfovibrio cuneatus]|uniref:radical SAM protein n=1 Tax=Desulfovibrio cuneatus TaxID=159728 RepID=UPI000418389A|nr:radical SAM protein [Desulfovibrio cuneatus]
MFPARWWQPLQQQATQRLEGTSPTPPSIKCGLCVHGCTLPPGAWGRCKARRNENGALVSPYLGRFCSLAADPMEKKPLYHFMPGTFILSLGSIGCTMCCPFCQNHTIAQPASKAALPPLSALTPEKLVVLAQHHNLPSVAYTYNEPTLQAEYILEAGPLLREAHIAAVMVTNGMMSAPMLAELLPVVDAFNFDVKTFNAKQYTRLGGNLAHVQQSVTAALAAGRHVELTHLVVPGISDSMEEFAALVQWVASLSPAIPLHISRYSPAHTYTAPSTPLETLQAMHQHASSVLRHVHVGNVPPSARPQKQ